MTQELSKDVASFIAGTEDHYLDHLAPLCELLEIPLYLFSASLFDKVKRFYPNVTAILGTYEKEFKEMFRSKKAIISCYPSLVLDRIFFYELSSSPQKPHYIWCPHGNSEKGFDDYFERLLAKEAFILCYGPKIEQRLFQCKTTKLIPLGNLRHFYSLHKKDHFDALIAAEAPFLNRAERKILYAPTWSDHLSDAEFKGQLSALLTARPPSLVLIVKLHPNQLKKYEVVLSHIQEEFASDNLYFLNDFPPIYPLLSRIDIYVGNHSSLLFDTLAFEMPALLIDDTVPFAPSISSKNLKELFSSLEMLPHDKKSMKKAYKDAYYENFSIETLKKEIEKTYSDSKGGMIVT
jgi:hypothetical protein